MFKPSFRIEKCPICQSDLTVKEFQGYGTTSGYNAHCPNCNRYDDIWACGIRELAVGDWKSDSFMSDYGILSPEEQDIEAANLKKLNRLIFLEKLKYRFLPKKRKED